MNKFVVLLLISFGVWGIGSAQANIFFNDDFSYADGSLITNSGGLWIDHSGTVGQMQVFGGQAIVSGANTEDVHRNAGVTMGAGDTWYAGFDVTVSGPVGTVYFAHFLEGTTFFGGRVWITSPTSGGDFAFGLSGGSSLDQTWATDGSFGSTYRLVVSYDYDSGATQLWVDPATEGDTSLTSTTGFANDAMTSFAFRESSNPSTEAIDNLTLANTFQEALTGVAVPEPSIIALSAVGGLAFLLAMRRKR